MFLRPSIVCVQCGNHFMTYVCTYLYFETKQNQSFYIAGCYAPDRVRKLFDVWHERSQKSSQTIVTKIYDKTSSNWDQQTQKHRIGILALEVYYQCIPLCLSTCTATFETICDSYQNRFESILRICHEVSAFDCHHSPSQSDTGDKILEYSPDIDPPLFLLAILCRDPGFRGQALILLRRMHEARHGGNNDCINVKILITVLALEEQGLSPAPRSCGDIPEPNRIKLLSFDKGNKGNLRLKYAKNPYQGPKATIKTIEAHIKAKNIPRLGSASLWPLGECIRIAWHLGLVRLPRRRCWCKSYGTL